MSEDAGGHRGRARSRTYSSDDDGFTGEIDALSVADGGASNTSSSSSSSKSTTTTTTTSVKPQVSKKTIAIMTKLDAAGTRTPDQGADDKNSLGSDDEEAAAEKELEALERKKRLAASSGSATTSSSSSGSGSTSSSGGGSAPSSSSSSSAGASSGSGAASSRAAANRRAKKGEEGEYDVLVKILLLGDSGVGKTSLMLRYSEDKFSPSMTSTAGVDYKSQMLDVEGKKIKCQIWDTAGQQRFHVITHSYYKSAHGIVLVYDVSEPHEESFNNIRYWMENIQKHASPNTQKVLLGNKIDVKGKKIETSRGKALADEYSMKFFEVSAKEGTSVVESFNTLARDVIGKMLDTGAAGGGSGSGSSTGSGAGGGAGESGDKKKENCSIM